MSDTSCDSMKTQEIVKQVLSVYEALIAYVVNTWNTESDSQIAKRLIGLHKAYSRVVEFVKVGQPFKHSCLCITSELKENNCITSCTFADFLAIVFSFKILVVLFEMNVLFCRMWTKLQKRKIKIPRKTL